MAKDYTKRLDSRLGSINSQYEIDYKELKTMIEKLDNTLNKTINDEIERLIPKDEKRRYMQSYPDEKLKTRARGLKSSDFFKITGKSISDVPNARINALSEIKPSELVKPKVMNSKNELVDKFTDSEWEALSINNKREEYFESLDKDKQLEYVFKGMDDDKKVEFIKAEPGIFFESLSDDEKLYLIAEYSAGEDEKDATRQAFDSSLKKGQKRKDELKDQIKQSAQELINRMNKVIDDNKKIIETLENEIAKKKQELSTLEDTPIDLSKYYQGRNTKETPDRLENLNKIEEANKAKAIATLKGRIQELTSDLEDARNKQLEIEKKVREYEENIRSLLEPKKIYLDSKSSEEKSDSVLPNTAIEKFGTAATGNSKLKQSKKAKNMLDNLRLSNDTEDFRDMLRNSTYDQLVAQAAQIKWPWNKRSLNDFYNRAIEDLQHRDENKNIETLLSQKCGIKIKDLYHMGNLTVDQVKKIQYCLMDLNDNYSTVSQKEKNEIDMIMDYIKIGMLKQQSEHAKFIKNIVRNRNVRGRLDTLAVQLIKYGKHQYNEKNSILDRYNSFRKSIHIKEIDKSKVLKNTGRPDPENVTARTIR